MTRLYRDLVPTFPDRADWTLARVLDHYADSTPGSGLFGGP